MSRHRAEAIKVSIYEFDEEKYRRLKREVLKTSTDEAYCRELYQKFGIADIPESNRV